MAVGAAIRAARRSADAQTRAAIRTSLVGFATAGCPAAALVLAWFDRDGAICDDASTGGVDGR
ncbi:hypothetical protein ASF65_03850 [Aureimonas sp. Leaf324]|nr:hypothetical protein ASF65_03850 [Aureimonas sp. Leaf324]